MPQKRDLLALVAAAAVVAAVLLIASLNQGGLVVEGVEIRSEANAFELFPLLSAKSSFTLSPVIHEPSTPTDTKIFEGTALFITVLQGNGKDVTQLFRVVDSENRLQHCVTNYGDISKAEEISVQQCNGMLQDGEGVAVYLEQPDHALQRPVIGLQQNSITVTANSSATIPKASFVALKIMYRNSGEVIEKANLLTESIKS